MVDWIHNVISPIIQIVFIVGILGFILYFVFKALHNAWSKSVKFTLKYKIFKKPYPEDKVTWVIECMDKKMGYYDAKKELLLSNDPNINVAEYMWLYEQIWNQLNKNKQKGGKKHGKQSKGSN